jgi:inositol-1,3,4-trisphosphate 5/6-kinase / inositol-tetrakisphosphate 1-kinase
MDLLGYDIVIDSETNEKYLVDLNYFPCKFFILFYFLLKLFLKAFVGVKDLNELLFNNIEKRYQNFKMKKNK